LKGSELLVDCLLASFFCGISLRDTARKHRVCLNTGSLDCWCGNLLLCFALHAFQTNIARVGG
jgi:hypothetical protein